MTRSDAGGGPTLALGSRADGTRQVSSNLIVRVVVVKTEDGVRLSYGAVLYALCRIAQLRGGNIPHGAILAELMQLLGIHVALIECPESARYFAGGRVYQTGDNFQGSTPERPETFVRP
jgi:hypothetical protein